jgi:RNA polymerase sigma-70 factor (sigma-E family)
MASMAGYDEFVTARWASLVRSAMLLGCTRTDAEDVAQTALVRCYAAWRRVSAADDPNAYVYRTMVNCLRKSRRRRWWGEAPVGLVLDSGAVHDDHATSVSTAHAVLAALRELPREQREVLVLRYFSDLTERETAEVLRVPVGTVKSRASRALAVLARDESVADVYSRERKAT